MSDYAKGGPGHFSGDVVGHGQGDEDVIVDLMMRADTSYFMRVKLRSHVKPSVWTINEVDLDRYTSEKDFLKAVGVAAAAAVEHQANVYGDKHSEKDVMHAAVEAAVEIMHQVNQPKH